MIWQQHKSSHGARRGAVSVLAALLIVLMFGFVAFAVDLGYLAVVQTELQRSADAAALAGGYELFADGSLSGNSDMTGAVANARTQVALYAASNPVGGKQPSVDNTNGGDVTIGYLSNPMDPNCVLDTSAAHFNQSNAVQVRVRRTSAMNGNVSFFFGQLLGMGSVGTQSQATAAVINNFSGFQSPGGMGNLMILPYALDQQTWNDLLAGGGTDNYAYQAAGGGHCGASSAGTVSSGSDGIKEVNLFPQGTGSPGNRGTVDIGSNNNSTATLARQILNGITPGDLAPYGGQLKFDSNGNLYLNGDTGISAGVKDELTSIIGQPRIIPIFKSVTGPGNNATYQIVAFAGVRILDVRLTGSMDSKMLMVQPCKVTTNGAIPSAGPTTSYFVVSPTWLVR